MEFLQSYLSNVTRHPFHLVDESPWPLLSSFAGGFVALGLLGLFLNSSSGLIFTSLTFLALIMVQWWLDVSVEGTYQGLHSKVVQIGLSWGMILFISSEVLFFFSFFWGYFHSSLVPSVEIGGGEWPPLGVTGLSAWEIPLLNTIILLSSGASVTWSHHSLVMGKHQNASLSLLITVLLGGYFTCLQGVEYFEASFSISDSVYGSTFFLLTGFHGLHVLVGATFLGVCYFRMLSGHFGNSHHFGFEAAAWYWHFVDVVWLFLFLGVYCLVKKGCY
ncbi:cytochrome c oxidase subunit III (mitochondrion) [Lepeophtheirus salmonis]|uniref:Cytochrome c oxidase subunit 3 n=1 Tax=Lepeophtheirus salmonis TaxID=72036 RepID=A9QXI6_LEPSM|nr:cytochrome c oxidase subunit III [Lepeophtheirus salmonis]ABX59304.1 cytochrome c oxidase subunit III [Lepeophtheirus salmonis]